MVPEFEQACFGNEPGARVKVQTQFGYHVIQVVAKARAPGDMHPMQLQELLGSPSEKEECQLIDVREPDELERADIKGAGFLNLPLSQFPQWRVDRFGLACWRMLWWWGDQSMGVGALPPAPPVSPVFPLPPPPVHTQPTNRGPKVLSGELLDKSKKTVVLCHHGGRSMQVASFLASQAGFQVRGGRYAGVCIASLAALTPTD